MEVKLPTLLKRYDRQTNRPTYKSIDQPTIQQTDRPGHSEISLPIMMKCLYINISLFMQIVRQLGVRINN